MILHKNGAGWLFKMVMTGVAEVSYLRANTTGPVLTLDRFSLTVLPDNIKFIRGRHD